MNVRPAAAGLGATRPPSAARRRFGLVLVAATLFLLLAGAEVKSRDAGLAVPDWPLSFGRWMPPMVGNIFYEHGHRMVAATVGLLTIVLALWTARAEARPLVRRLAWGALALVCVQGLLGGLTVKLLLPPPVSVGHALLAQSFLCLLVWIAFLNSREGFAPPGAGAPASEASGAARSALRAAAWATGAVFVQLLLGALVRHTESEMAVPFFPLSETGSLLPERVTGQVVIHMAHRGFAVVVTALVLRAAWIAARSARRLRPHALLAGALVLGQVLLGAAIVWNPVPSQTDGITPRAAPLIASSHLVLGATLLATVWLLALRAHRAAGAARLEPARGPAAEASGPVRVPVGSSR